MTSCSVLECERIVHARGWCKGHHERWRTTGGVQAEKPLRTRTPSGLGLVEAFFWQMARTPPAAGCWLWPGHTTEGGYGVVANGVREYAHRIAYSIFVAPVPDGEVVRHSCDTPPCCQPLHLTPGTHLDNIEDMVSRHRSYWGERHHWAKLTREQVLEIRTRAALGERNRDLAAAFAISPPQITSIIKRRSWTHV